MPGHIVLDRGRVVFVETQTNDLPQMQDGANEMSGKLTAEQKKDAERLKFAIAAWKSRRKQSGLPCRLEDLGAMVGGITQGMVSFYQNGKVPLNKRALVMFSSALGVSQESISPRIAAAPIASLKGLSAAGMVYDWGEFTQAHRDHPDALPAVFSVLASDSHFHGRIGAGEVLVLCSTKTQQIKPNDGIVITSRDNQLRLAVYKPNADGTFFARLSNGNMMHSDVDGAQIVYMVVGMPSLRWSKIF